MRHHPWYIQAEHQDEASGVALGRLSLGVFSRASAPAEDGSGKWLGLLEGEIHDLDSTRRELERQGCRFETDEAAEVLLKGFAHRGAPFLRSLSGSFVAALWNVAERRLVLTNDRFGMKPLYYAHQPGRLQFASEIKALLCDSRLPRALNHHGVAQLFMFGQLWNEDTLYEAVHAVPAAGLLEYEAESDRLRVSVYREPVEPPAPITAEADALDRIDVAFGNAMRRRAAGARSLGISLSGGLDSRTVLAGLDPARDPVITVSLGVAGSIDHRCAEEMARIQGCRHHMFVNDAEFLSRYLAHLTAMVRLTDGHYISQCIAEPAIPYYRALGIDVLLRGHAGELMHLDKAYNFSVDRDAWSILSEDQLERWLMSRLAAFVSGPDQAALFAGRAPGEMKGHARESLRRSLVASKNIEHPVDRIWQLFLAQRLRRETALSLVQFGTQVETRVPLLDEELVDALAAAPVSLRVGDRIQSHLIDRRRPALLNVINANTGARMGASPLANSLSRFRMKALRRLGVPGYQAYESLGSWLRRELQPLAADLVLSERSLSRGVFTPDVVRRIAREHFESRANHTYLLLVLMIFELGQRMFLDSEDSLVEDPRLAAAGA
jgi:asparagine synthase (glutamine-hydrolysing)